MKHVVITGATSMLGVALLHKCLEEGTRVYAVARPGSRNMRRLPAHDAVTVVECENSALASLPAWITERGFDAFYHFSWDGTSRNMRGDPFVQEANVHDSLQAVAAANELGCAAFIGAGSQAEYGRVQGRIAPDTCARPEYAYGMAKLAAAGLCGQLCEKLGMRYVWGRVFSVYGEYDNSDTLVSYLINALFAGEVPALTECGQMWDYLYAGDAAEAFYKLGEKGSGIYCIGSGQVRPLREYVEIIRSLICPQARLGFGEKPYAPNQVMHLNADIASLQKDTGFHPRTDFAAGVAKTIEWWKKEHGKKD